MNDMDRSFLVATTSRYILTGDADPHEWVVAKMVTFLGRMEYGVWRLACITHTRVLLSVLYGSGGRYRGRDQEVLDDRTQTGPVFQDGIL